MEEGLVVASNRGPVGWHRDDEGSLIPQRGFGGLVTALGGAMQREPGTWVSVALSNGDRKIAAEHGGRPFTVDADGSGYRLRLLDVGDRFDAYYNEVSNRLLWFTLHALWGAPYEPTGAGWRPAWHDGYRQVNTDIARVVVEEAADGGEIYLQDYHLFTAGASIREALPEARLLHYVHTPWVGPDYLQRLPDPISEGILRGLLAADVVGFSSPNWSHAFRRCAAEFLEATVEGEGVWFEGRRTNVADFVLGVDEEDLAASAASDDVRQAGERLDDELAGRRLLLRVDRTDLSKNIYRGLLAYELLLERHPEHRGRVWHYAHLNPSRQDVPDYEEYLNVCLDTADRIRERFGEESLTLFVGDDYPRAVAAQQRYDVLFANPVIDGTNLVAKEGPVLNTRSGALVLSRRAGASALLADAALLVNPYDIEEQADALHAALTLSATERAARAASLREASRVGGPEEWFAAQRYMLRATVARRR